MSVFFGQPAASDLLVSADDFTSWFDLGVTATLDASAQARIQIALAVASAAVRTKTQQQLSVVAETVTLSATGNQVLALPQFPVSAVSSVTRDGATLAPTAYQWASPVGIITTLDGSRWLTPQVITVTYTHGWDPLPADIAGVVLARAKRWYDNPAGQPVQSETLGSWAVTYAAAAGEFTNEELDILTRYSLWTVVS